MYRCIPFVVNNTPEKDWLFSILRQTQSIQAQDEWYLEYLPNIRLTRISSYCTQFGQRTGIILLLIFMITDECIGWGPGEFVLADCQCVISYLIPRPSPIPWPYATNIESVDKHWVGDTRSNQSYWQFTRVLNREKSATRLEVFEIDLTGRMWYCLLQPYRGSLLQHM